jgi:hypothetical protein
VGLDRDLFVSRIAYLSRPVALAAGEDGELWCVVARGDGPDGPHAILSARTGVEVPLGGRPLGLAAGNRQALVLLEGAREAEVWRVGARGAAHLVARVSAGTCIAVRGDQILVGDARGGVNLLDRRGARRVHLGGEVLAVAAGTGSSWWALIASPRVRLVSLSADLVKQRVSHTDLENATLAVVGSSGSAWLVAGRERRALRIGPDGRVERSLSDLPLAGLIAGAATEDGGLLLLAPGAVLRVDSAGRVDRGQGGFGFLVDMALAAR